MKRLLPSIVLAASLAAWGQSAEIAHPDPRVEARLKVIAHELRCLVCQNQTIADSNAPLAVDLRQQVRGMVASGKSDDEIRTYMVERYGDFVGGPLGPGSESQVLVCRRAARTSRR